MAHKTSAPSPKSGTGAAPKSFSLGDREAPGAIKQPSSGGIQAIKPGLDPERGTSGADGVA